jgi:hypothetical protein
MEKYVLQTKKSFICSTLFASVTVFDSIIRFYVVGTVATGYFP